MKFLLLALFVAVATAAPTPDEDVGEPVELIVNGVPEGEALEIGEIVDISLKHHIDGELAAATNLLHPLTAVGIAEIQAAAAEVVIPEPIALPQPAAPEVVIPEPVVLPHPVAPEVVIPEPVVLPQPVAPEVVIPEPVVLPQPVAPEVVIPEPVVLPQPVAPEVVIPEPVVLPQPVAPEVVLPEPIFVAPEAVAQPEVIPTPVAQVPNGEIFNNGAVQVTVNGPEDAGMFATLQTWFNMVLNYINNGVQMTQQII